MFLPNAYDTFRDQANNASMENDACTPETPQNSQGKRTRGGSVGDDGVSSVPGQLPDKDWAAWAREWREDPQGKADRLVEQWDAESKANGGAGFKVGTGLAVSVRSG